MQLDVRHRTYVRILAALSLTLLVAPATAGSGRPDTAYDAAVHLARDIGSRPAASRAELRAHRYVKRRFERAGLDTAFTRFRVPNRGRGWSRNVVGEYDGPRRCLKIVMAHAD